MLEDNVFSFRGKGKSRFGTEFLRGAVGAFYAVDGQVCVWKAVSCGANLFGFEETNLAVNKQKVPATFPGPPSRVVTDR